MTILLPTLAIAFAAFCVWPVVRIVNRRERWAKWTAISIAVPAFYVASWIPMARLAEWLAVRDLLPGWAATALAIFYVPMQYAVALWFLIFGG